MIFNFTSILSANYHELAYSFKFKGINGKEINLNDYEGKVMIIVNVASRCGYTLNMQICKLYGVITKRFSSYRSSNK